MRSREAAPVVGAEMVRIPKRCGLLDSRVRGNDTRGIRGLIPQLGVKIANGSIPAGTAADLSLLEYTTLSRFSQRLFWIMQQEDRQLGSRKRPSAKRPALCRTIAPVETAEPR
jgi:hypothetical protein